MAEEGENADEVIEKCSDVFLNGESENLDNIGEDEASLENEENSVSEKILPRKSSFMNKNGSRKPPRKKTVSFSSMPTERKIATGGYERVDTKSAKFMQSFCIDLKCVTCEMTCTQETQ